MDSEVLRTGRLIALDGACGHDLRLAASRLFQSFGQGAIEGGISHWDASGIFAELRGQDPARFGPSPRTLVLLYATDLAFRLRWEIRPALEAGQWVIAAPYLHTVIGFGKATGLPGTWLRELLSFAPKPHACYRIPEGNPAGTRECGPSDGYFDFCCAALRDGGSCWDPVVVRYKFQAYLDALERRRGCETVTAELLAGSASLNVGQALSVGAGGREAPVGEPGETPRQQRRARRD